MLGVKLAQRLGIILPQKDWIQQLEELVLMQKDWMQQLEELVLMQKDTVQQLVELVLMQKEVIITHLVIHYLIGQLQYPM